MNSSSNLTSLSDQYNSMLRQYQQTYQNYIQNSHKNSHLVTVNDSAFWGNSGISQRSQPSVHDCLNSCKNQSSCSGATYNHSDQSCYLRSGNGNIISSPDKTAIISQSLQYSYQLKNLNQQLLNIQQQIKNQLEQSYSNVQNISTQQQDKNKIIDHNHDILQEDRDKIEQMIHEFELLNAADKNSQIVVTQEYSRYIVYLLIAILFFILVIKFSVFSVEQRGGGGFSSFFKSLNR